MTTPKILHIAPTDDVEEGLKHIRKKYPKAKVYGVGTSSGGNLALRYAGVTGANCKFDAICAIATPFDVNICSSNLVNSKNPITKASHNFLTANCIRLLSNNVESLKPHEKQLGLNIKAGLKARSTKEFDEAITLPIHGFKTAREYYDSISCVHVLHNIQVPVFCLSCKDDPI